MRCTATCAASTPGGGHSVASCLGYVAHETSVVHGAPRPESPPGERDLGYHRGVHLGMRLGSTGSDSAFIEEGSRIGSTDTPLEGSREYVAGVYLGIFEGTRTAILMYARLTAEKNAPLPTLQYGPMHETRANLVLAAATYSGATAREAASALAQLGFTRGATMGSTATSDTHGHSMAEEVEAAADVFATIDTIWAFTGLPPEALSPGDVLCITTR